MAATKEDFVGVRMATATRKVLKDLARQEGISEAEWIRRRILEPYQQKEARLREDLGFELKQIRLTLDHHRRWISRVRIQQLQHVLSLGNDEIGWYMFLAAKSRTPELYALKNFSQKTRLTLYREWRRKNIAEASATSFWTGLARQSGKTIWQLLCDDYRKSIQDEILQLQEETGPFQCPSCDAEPFETRDDLDDHIKKRHPKAREAKPKYFCPYCSDSEIFTNKRDLQFHVSNEHPDFWHAFKKWDVSL